MATAEKGKSVVWKFFHKTENGQFGFPAVVVMELMCNVVDGFLNGTLSLSYDRLDYYTHTAKQINVV